MRSSALLDERAESASRLINLTMGLHRMQVSRLGKDPAPSRLDAPDFDHLQVLRQATLLRTLSITESFCVDRLLEHAEREVSPYESAVRASIWAKASTGAVSTWDGIRDSYKSWYDIRPDWEPLAQLVEVRNAIAHGLGELTRLQRAKLRSTLTKITGAGVKVDGALIVLEETNLERTRVVCLELIAEIDYRVQALA